MSSSSTVAEKRQGSCHCGDVAYTVTLENKPLSEMTVVVCNCSICQRSGQMLIYPPKRCLEFQKGSFEELRTYQFNKKICTYYSCPRCSSQLFGVPQIDLSKLAEAPKDTSGRFPAEPFLTLNVRMLHDVDLDSLKIEKVDGKSIN